MSRLFPALLALLTLAADWPVFRGDAAMTGTTAEKLPDTLQQLWAVKTGDSIDGAPAIVKGIAYVGSFDNHLYALDLATGGVKWKAKLGPIKASPAVADGLIYVGDADGKFYCVDAANGTTKWTAEADAEITSGANFAGDAVLFGSQDGNLYCYGRDGKQRWKYAIDGPINGAPAVAGGKALVAGCDSVLHAVDVTTGKASTTVRLDGQTGATPAAAGGTAFVGLMTNQFLAVDLAKAEVAWKFQAARRAQPFYASAAVTEKLVIAGGRDRRVVALDRVTGNEVWAFEAGNRIDSSPVVASDKVYAATLDNRLHVLALADGKEIQQFKLDGPINGSPAVAGGRLVVGTQAGTVYCFGAK